MKIFLLLCYFATWAFIPHLLLLKKRPAATLAWLWAILFIPLLGALMYFAIGTDRLKRRRLKRRNLFSARASRQSVPAGSTDERTAALLKNLPQRDRQFLQLLSRINQLPVSSGTDLRILRNTTEFYPALEARIRAARHHLHLEFYIWQGDETGVRFLQLLTEAAQRGVIVRLLLDGVGSHGFSEDLLTEYRRAGGHFSWFQSLDPKRKRFFLNLRNHRKLQIIDGAVAFVGGMNIGREYEGLDPALGHWRDVQVEVTGSVTCELQQVFADDWFFATDEKISQPGYYPTCPVTPLYPVHIVLGGPDRRNEPISKSIVSLLNEATERVWIATGYFVPDDILAGALELAASRGLDVRLLISERSDHPGLVVVGRSYYDQLLAAGVRIFEYSAGINHAKIALADTDWGMVGSANLDYRSMRLNFELNLLFYSPERNIELAQILEHDFALSQEIEPEIFARRPFRQKFLEAALRPLSPLKVGCDAFAGYVQHPLLPSPRPGYSPELAMVAINLFTARRRTSRTADHAARAATSREEALHDVTLVRRFNAGDAEAFVEIVARYREKMFAVAFGQLRNHADAEEIAQDTFIRAHRALAQFRGDSSLSTWLHRITVNLANNRYWYFFRRRRHMTQSLDQAMGHDNPATLAEVVACDAPGPVRDATNHEFSDLVAKCMEQLRPQQREILNQRNNQHCSYEEIAVALGINVGTVKSRIARARECLRGFLTKACPEFPAESLPPDWFDPVRPASRWQVGFA